MRNDAGKRGLAKSRRTVEQDMVKRLIAASRSLDIYGEILLDLILSDIISECFRAERDLEIAVLRNDLGACEALGFVLKHRISSLYHMNTVLRS